MASLRRLLNSPYWIACFTLPDGRRTQRSTKTANRQEAKRIANKFEDASEDGTEGRLTEVQARKVIADIFAIANKNSLPSSTIRDFMTSWLKRKELEATEKTHQRYKTVVNHLLDYLGPKANFDIAHLASKEITGFRDDLAGRLTVGTVNISLKILRTALSQARRDGIVDANEAQRVSLLKNRTTDRRRPFSLEELKKILGNANHEWRGMILVGLYTGLRLSDVATLTWLNADLERRELTVTTAKTGRRQILPLAKPVFDYLEALPSSDKPDEALFPEAYAARQRSLYGGTLSNQFYQILVAAGLAQKRTHVSQEKGRGARRELNALSFHSLRHTATSLLKNAGVSDVVARDIIGHESEAVSRNYTHIDLATKRKAVDGMPDVTQLESPQ
ncbi:MAG: tyrosine-type recombinase/integrase [Verrucomicrobiota bacterium]